MKVLFITYPMAFHTPGGGEIQLLAYQKHLEKLGVQVELFNPWEPNFLDYDLVHYFSVIGGSIHICNFIKSLGIPLVISSSLWITEESKHLYPIEEIKQQLSFADIIIANSDVESDNIAQVLKLPRENFKTIYNGVEDIFFNKVDGEKFKKHFKIEDKFILNVGNIEPRKNQLSLVKAMKAFPELKLILIGYERDQTYAKQIKETGNGQVVFLGPLDHTDILLRSAFSLCEVFCLPSTLETPGLAALEALATSCQVVITEIGATKEYFGDSVWYVDPHSIDSIISGINMALKYEKKEELDLKFRWRIVTQSLEKIYENILGRDVYGIR